jgi:hypothetical protein
VIGVHYGGYYLSLMFMFKVDGLMVWHIVRQGQRSILEVRICRLKCGTLFQVMKFLLGVLVCKPICKQNDQEKRLTGP